MRVKFGARLDGLHYLLWYAAAVYDYVRQANGLGEGTITSGLDGGDAIGPARVSNSQHPRGTAIDLRTNDLNVAVRGDLADVLREALGPDFDVVLEPDHIHIELSRSALNRT